MNERIKELAIEANLISSESNGFDQTRLSIAQQKFAELIVQECNRYACSAWEHGPLLGKDLLIHFGIVRLNDEQTY
jgi:hypothetical protein